MQQKKPKKSTTPAARGPKRTGSKAAAGPPTHFFEKLLDKDDTPADTLSMYALYRVSMQFGQVQPWLTVHETEVFAVDPPGGPRCYCSVIGSGGTLFRLTVYQGDEGYGLFRRMSTGTIDRMDVYTTCNLIYADFVPPAELEKPDRDMLKLFGSQLDRDALWPQFRSIRKGCREWYVDAREAAILMECLRAAVVITAELGGNADATHWKSKATLPLVRVEVDGSHVNTAIEQVPVPAPADPASPARMDEGTAEVDLAELNTLLAAVDRGSRAWEVDCFWAPIPVGGATHRPRFPRMAMAVDADSGYVFAPEMQEASVPAPELMLQAVLNVVRQHHALPGELHVSSEDRRTALANLGKALDIPVIVKKELPMLSEAQRSFHAHLMGGR